MSEPNPLPTLTQQGDGQGYSSLLKLPEHIQGAQDLLGKYCFLILRNAYCALHSPLFIKYMKSEGPLAWSHGVYHLAFFIEGSEGEKS